MTLRVTVEIIPHGQEEMKYKLSTMNISNLCVVHDGLTKYFVEEIPEKGNTKSWNTYHVRKEGYWTLVRRALEDLCPYTETVDAPKL